MPYFDEDAIRECMRIGPNYNEEDYEYELKDDQRMAEAGYNRFEVLEYWGLMDADYAKEWESNSQKKSIFLMRFRLMLGFVTALYSGLLLIPLPHTAFPTTLSHTRETHIVSLA